MKPPTHRLLVVDDNLAIHEDFRKVLESASPNSQLRETEALLFGLTEPPLTGPARTFRLTFCSQGENGVKLVRDARDSGDRIAVAFVDVRMPPGINGIETARQIWEIDPDVQIVICTAFADFSWTEMASELGFPDRWVILKKPFDNVEVLQLAHALADKWSLRQQTKTHLTNLQRAVAARTADLESALDRLRGEIDQRERSEQERRELERKMEETQRLESLGVLAGGIAHDFNNLLTGVLVSASLARLDAKLGTELHRQLNVIEENSRRAAGLCEQMLTYAGRANVETQIVDVNALLRESLDLLRVSIPKDAEFNMSLFADLPTVSGDPSRLRQVFMNLVLNAAEALAGAPKRITLSSGVANLDDAALGRLAHPGTAKAGTFVFVEVRDSGSGMPPEVLHRIFEPFFTTKFAGRGLGLCAVLGIVRSHAGGVDVTSELGRGTTVRVYLPAAGNAAKLSAKNAVPELQTNLAGTIVLADDEESVRCVAAAVLQRLGLTVLEARDGAEAIELGRSHSAPLTGLVLDLTMPRMNGFAALASLREKQPHLPAILMTGFDATDAEVRARALEGVTILQKPFSLDQLVRAANEKFGRS